MQFELKKLSLNDGEEVYKMLQKIPSEENNYFNPIYGVSYEKYKEWLVKSHEEALQEGLKDGWKVPQTTYWFYADGILAGKGEVRHFLTDALRKRGGNIGYTIVPDQRGKGFGTKLLELLLNEAKMMGIEKVLLTIRSDNMASLAAAKANGGVAEYEDEENNETYIWINTK